MKTITENIMKIMYYIHHLIIYDFRALVRIAIRPTETWYTAWRITPNNGDIAGVQVIGYLQQPVVFDGKEKIDVIPYPHKTVKGNCVVRVFAKESRPYYYGNGMVYVRHMRLSGKACSIYIEAKYNKRRELDYINKAVCEMYPEYKGIKFRTTVEEKNQPMYFRQNM